MPRTGRVTRRPPRRAERVRVAEAARLGHHDEAVEGPSREGSQGEAGLDLPGQTAAAGAESPEHRDRRLAAGQQDRARPPALDPDPRGVRQAGDGLAALNGIIDPLSLGRRQHVEARPLGEPRELRLGGGVRAPGDHDQGPPGKNPPDAGRRGDLALGERRRQPGRPGQEYRPVASHLRQHREIRVGIRVRDEHPSAGPAEAQEPRRHGIPASTHRPQRQRGVGRTPPATRSPSTLAPVRGKVGSRAIGVSSASRPSTRTQPSMTVRRWAGKAGVRSASPSLAPSSIPSISAATRPRSVESTFL